MNVNDVFSTEGIPKLTYVEPANFYDIYLDVLTKGKPMVLEGATGTGKTTIIHKIIEKLENELQIVYLKAGKDKVRIIQLSNLENIKGKSIYVIDDFHALEQITKEKLATIAKDAADEGEKSTNPKLILIGINKTGSNLIEIKPDIGKRIGIHKIIGASLARTKEIISKGESLLNIKIPSHHLIYNEVKGDYWLIQSFCKTICSKNKIVEKTELTTKLKYNIKDIRESIIEKLESIYFLNAIYEFSVGYKEFRVNNSAYYLFLKYLSNRNDFPIELNHKNIYANTEFEIAIESLLFNRLETLLKQKYDKLSRYFYFNVKNKIFNIEDPALLYYLKNLDWEKLRKKIGIQLNQSHYLYDIAISYAGENNSIAEEIAKQMLENDYSVYYAKFFEAEKLGFRLEVQFDKIYDIESRYVIVLLDENYKNKYFTNYELNVFKPKIDKNRVIPILLDNTDFSEVIPKDMLSIDFSKKNLMLEPIDLKIKVKDEIIKKLTEKIK